MNPEPEGTINGAWMPNVVFEIGSPITREILFESFSRENIDARVFFWPLSSIPPMKMHESNFNSNANSIPERSINLPSYHDMSDEDINRVSGVIFDLLNEYASS